MSRNRTKSSHWLRNSLLSLLGLAVTAVGAVVLLGRRKAEETPDGQRTPEGNDPNQTTPAGPQ